MRNRMYGGVRGRKTKVGEKLLRFPPTRLTFIRILISLRRWRWRRVPPNVGLVIKLLSYVATNRRKGAL